MKLSYRYRGMQITLVTVFVCSLLSCKKYLGEKPLKTQVTPAVLNDLQALLDAHSDMNQYSSELSETIADNYYVTTASWQSNNLLDRQNYVWDKDATHINSWRIPYAKPVYIANVVLDQLPLMSNASAEPDYYNQIKGSALFFRAFTFLKMADLYCRPYSSTASTDLGIVLRLNSSLEEPSVRSTVFETYDQITRDLKTALVLLPSTTPFPTRPTKAAALGLLARTYLSMREYAKAGEYANLYLLQRPELIDYNTLSPYLTRFNKETIFYNHSNSISSIVYAFSGAKVDSTLYLSYDNNDLRKTVFFANNPDGTKAFQGSYERTIYPGIVFDGILTDEIYLIRAECYARAGNKDAAMADLNTLLVNRYRPGFVPLTAPDAATALSIILTERRKELVFRGIRWSDIRRLNLEGANITLKRIINGVTYTLPPNDLRSVLLIPAEIMALTNLQQNPR